MKLKRLGALLLAAALTMSMTACGDSDEDSKESKKDKASSSSASQQESTADASSSEETTTTTAEEAEPAPLISVKEYLTSGVWVFTDDTIADLTQAIEKRGFDMFYFFTYRYYNSTNFYPTDSDKDKDYVMSPLCLIGKEYNNSRDMYGGFYSVDAVDGQAFQEEMEYNVELRSECFSADGTLKGNTITFDDYEIDGSDFTEDISLTKPITLVRKEIIPVEEQVKNLVGSWKIVNDEKLLKGVNAVYSDDNTYKDCMENFVGKTITISEDGKFSGTVTELPEFKKSDEVSFYDPEKDHTSYFAKIGNCSIDYLYRENDDVLLIGYNYQYPFFLEKID